MVVGLLIGLAIGALGVWLLLRTKTDDLTVRFNALAADALRQNNETFLGIATDKLDHKLGEGEHAVEQLVKPLKESLAKVAEQAEALERSRRQDYGSLHKSLETLVQTNEGVRAETSRLATALRSSEVRGAWGQMQLRNAVETAGMLAYCDFEEEVHTVADGRTLRPDMVVRLPGNRRIVVDAKTPLKALLDATSAPEDQQARFVADYARHVREHVKQLSSKSYWDQLDGTPDYVVMFLPGEGFFRTAVEADPSLLGTGGNDRVILASPMMLIALLRLVGSVWNEEKVAESAREVNRLGQELYERLSTMTDHFATLGKRLDGAVQAYNQSVGSMERRVLPKARELTAHGVRSTKELPELEGVDRAAQPPQTVDIPRARDAA
ncbi:MAG TPA: DNA recombination protein RmuC [Gaiellaceae bacterium]|jgi:DNA recombination protein RmuC